MDLQQTGRVLFGSAASKASNFISALITNVNTSEKHSVPFCWFLQRCIYELVLRLDNSRPIILDFSSQFLMFQFGDSSQPGSVYGSSQGQTHRNSFYAGCKRVYAGFQCFCCLIKMLHTKPHCSVFIGKISACYSQRLFQIVAILTASGAASCPQQLHPH